MSRGKGLSLLIVAIGLAVVAIFYIVNPPNRPDSSRGDTSAHAMKIRMEWREPLTSTQRDEILRLLTIQPVSEEEAELQESAIVVAGASRRPVFIQRLLKLAFRDGPNADAAARALGLIADKDLVDDILEECAKSESDVKERRLAYALDHKLDSRARSILFDLSKSQDESTSDAAVAVLKRNGAWPE